MGYNYYNVIFITCVMCWIICQNLYSESLDRGWLTQFGFSFSTDLTDISQISYLYNNGKKGPKKCASVPLFVLLHCASPLFVFVCLFVCFVTLCITTLCFRLFVWLECASLLCAFIHLLCYIVRPQSVFCSFI